MANWIRRVCFRHNCIMRFGEGNIGVDRMSGVEC